MCKKIINVTACWHQTPRLFCCSRWTLLFCHLKRQTRCWPQVDKRRSYIIALTERGMHAIKAAGVRIPLLGDGGGYLGAVTHQASGKPRVGTADGSVSFERRVPCPVPCEERGECVESTVSLAQHAGLPTSTRLCFSELFTIHGRGICGRALTYAQVGAHLDGLTVYHGDVYSGCSCKPVACTRTICYALERW